MTQTNKKLKVVLDTNIFLVSVPEKSKYHIIFDKFIDDHFDLCITNEILKEYEEMLYERYDSETVENIIEILLITDNVIKSNIYFNWNLISVDPDDNKFIDCVVASNADYLVTNDKHFDILNEVDFPKINVIKIDKFMKLLK